jgi:imidazolonepropionase-like amidohydrolase
MRQIGFEQEFIKAGVHYITGSGADAFGTLPGISEHIEIEMLHQYGLSNRQAIAAATGNPSLFNHWPDIGLIEKGRNADLLLLAANPLDDLENLKKIDMLWLNGQLIDRPALLKIKP